MDLQPIPHCPICRMNGDSIPAIGMGTIRLRLRCRKGRRLTLKHMLFAPAAALRLISVGKLTDDDLMTIFESDACHIRTKSGKTIADGTRKGNGLYYFAGRDPKVSKHAFISRASPDIATWHR